MFFQDHRVFCGHPGREHIDADPNMVGRSLDARDHLFRIKLFHIRINDLNHMQIGRAHV